jgi:serine/threonine protein kinase
VYRARGKGADGKTWTYAVKRILPAYTADPDLRKMFAEEARIASMLVHENIVRVYDLARAENDEYFIVMEFLEGRDLAEAIEMVSVHGRRLPVWLAVHCAREVLQALNYATTVARDRAGNLLGLIHRDISPQNIFVTFDGEVKLTDFGVAKVQQSSLLTQVGVTKGKFGYMSPEQVGSMPLDPRSDLYNVGILLFEVTSGTRLFPGDNPSQILQTMMRGEIRALDADIGCPPELEALMRRALDKNRDKRPATAAAFDAELAAIQTTYGLQVTDAHLQGEWRALFRQEMAVANSSDDVASPRRLVSVHAGEPLASEPSSRSRRRSSGTKPAHPELSVAPGATIEGDSLGSSPPRRTRVAAGGGHKAVMLDQEKKKRPMKEVPAEVHFGPRGISTRSPRVVPLDDKKEGR